MKHAFSTLAEPTWSLQQFLDAAKQFGYDGIDLRGIKDQLDITLLPEFNENLNQTLDELARRGLQIAGLSTSVRCVGKPEEFEQYLGELKRYCALASRLGSPFVRVFGGKIPDGMVFDQALEKAAENLKRYGNIAEKYGVKIVLETHDDWSESSRVRALLEKAQHPTVGVVWDVHHPWRVAGETPQQTWQNIGRWVWYVHLKDAKGQPGGQQQLCLTGQGNVPVKESIEVLKANGYDGWLTFEWERRWHPELEPADVALKQHIEYVKALL